MVLTIQNKKETDMKKILSTLVWFIFLVPGIYLATIWQTIPARVPVHLNLKGEVDRYGNRNELVIMTLIITAVNIGAYLLLTNAYRFDSKKNAQYNKDFMQRMAFVISVFISVVLCTVIYSMLHHPARFTFSVLFSAVGLLFSFMGNYLYTIKPNYYAGFRLPWTLNNEENWKKTHLLGGKIFFAGGLLIAIVCLLVPAVIAIIVFFVITLIMIIIPFMYSYRLYKKQKSLA
jgi:uncharacterized membrane protein